MTALALVAGAAGVATAQVPLAANKQNVLKPHLRFDQLSGMTKGAISAITQDDSGLLWFGTEEGLGRYDGYSFTNYVPGVNVENNLSNFTVTSLAPGERTLWIGTAGGLEKLDLKTNTFTHLKSSAQDPKSLGSNIIVSLHLGKSGLLWIGTADAGVDSLDIASGEIRHYRANAGKGDTLTDDAISVVFEDSDGKVWVGTRESGLNRLDPTTGKVTRFLPEANKATSLSNAEITAIFQDSAGTLWIGTADGLNRFEAKTSTFKHFLKDTDQLKWITTIIESGDGGLWLGIKAIGVFRFDRRTGSIERYTHDGADATTIANPWVRSSYADRSGVLWFGFSSGEVSKLIAKRRDFPFYRTHPGLSFYEDGDTVWLGTEGHGIRSFNVKTGEVKSFLDEQLGATWTMSVIGGGDGSLWLGTTDHGLFHFTPSTGQLEGYDTTGGGLATDNVFALAHDGKNLWIGTGGAGLVRLDTKTATAEYFANNPAKPTTLSSDHVLAIHQDKRRDELLWVGTVVGLNAFDKRSGKSVRYVHDANKPDSLSHDQVTNIHEDKKGRLWVATWGGGLNLLDRDTGTFTFFRKKDGIASDVIFGILEDKNGAIWLTTNDGLSRLDPETKTIVNFSEGDGLQGDEFAQNAFAQGASGRFYVGGPRGFNMFSPEDIKPDSYVPPVVVTRFELLGESKPIPDEIELSFRDRWFTIEFSALAYASPSRNRYRYRLSGFHDWIETDRRFVSYSSLPSGNYTLEILGSNAHGLWNETGISIPIHVEPPPWRTWWAYTGYAAIVLLVVGLFLLRHRRQLEALKQAHRLTELEREMELTSLVQEGFFPTQPSVQDGSFRLEGFYRAANQCSGDWWWYERRDDHYLILVGDVTGHGSGPAMVTAAVAASFRSLGAVGSPGDEERLAAMNDEVLRCSRGQYHMTMTAVDVNTRTGAYSIWSAGGLPVFSLKPDTPAKPYVVQGTPLGSQHLQLGRLEGQLVPGERLLILTDGMPEVTTANSRLLGNRAIMNFFTQTRDMEIKGALQQMIWKVEGAQVGVQGDDWTVVLVQWGDEGIRIGQAAA